MPEARGSGVPGILTPRGWDGQCKSCRTGLGGKGEDGPSIASLVIGSQRPRNKPPGNPVGKRRHLNPPETSQFIHLEAEQVVKQIPGLMILC